MAQKIIDIMKMEKQCQVEELILTNHVVKQKTILTKFIIMSLDIKQKSIANDLHISQAQVSRLIAGEQYNPEFDKWIMHQLKEKVYCNQEKDAEFQLGRYK